MTVIVNESLKKMLERAEKAKRDKNLLEGLTKEPEIVVNGSQEIEVKPPTKEEVKTSNLPVSLNLSLTSENPLTKDEVMSNVSLTPRQLKGTQEQYNKARKAVGRLTTGASAAVPLICRGTSCPFSAKCVTGNTKVSTPEGTKLIRNISVGDLVYSLNTKGQVEISRVLAKEHSGVKLVFAIKTKLGLELHLTEDHKVLTETTLGNKGYRSLETGLRVGSKVFVLDTEMTLDIDTESYGDTFEDIIISISMLDETDVYDIEVEDNHNFFANSILVHNCSYYQMNLHEVGVNCLKEEQLIEYWTQKYIEEFDIDFNSITEMHTVSKLVEITIMDLRMSEYLSINNPDLMMDFISSIDPNGNALSNKGISVAFDVKERLERSKQKLLESLNGTREKKAKLVLQTNEQNLATARKEQLFDKLDLLASQVSGKKKGLIIDI